MMKRNPHNKIFEPDNQPATEHEVLIVTIVTKLGLVNGLEDFENKRYFASS
jgi:hypothetical protein